MTTTPPLHMLPPLDSPTLAGICHVELQLDRSFCIQLAKKACEASKVPNLPASELTDLHSQIQTACASKQSIPPDQELPQPQPDPERITRIQVMNRSSLRAAHDLQQQGHHSLILNFANGIHPGGGFLHGARAQEEALCRASALYATLKDDPFYAYHAQRPEPDSSDWMIHSPAVPVFWTECGDPWSTPWTADFITAAAPVASRIGQPRSGDLLQQRIHRMFHIAAYTQSRTLVLGAWGCGAFGNDPHRTARDFRDALEGPFRGYFDHVIFAIADWSPERRFLKPFISIFSKSHPL